MVFISRNWFAMQGPVAIILISWNVIFIWETGYWTRAIKRFALFDLLKSLYSDTKILSKYIPSLQKRLKTMDFHKVKMYKDKWSKKKMSKIFFFLSMCDVKMFLTEFGAVLTTVLPVLFKYCYKYCYSDSRNERGRFGALQSDSTHHFFRNACTKSGSLRFSQFSGCWLILSVYILMSFNFPFVRLLGVW